MAARPDRRPVRRDGALWRWAAAAVLAAMLLVGVGALRDELAVQRAQRQLRAAATGDAPVPLLSQATIDAVRPARAALLLGFAQARAAARTDDETLRERRLAAARALSAKATAGRPRWGLATLLGAYADTLAGQAASPTTREAVARSYDEDGFLAPVAAWRIRYGLSQWPGLTAAARTHVVEEAGWLSTRQGPGYVIVMPLIVGTPAEVPVMQVRSRLAHTSAILSSDSGESGGP